MMTPTIDTSGAVAVLNDVTSAATVVASSVAAPLDQRPAAVYLARLAVGARRAQLGALHTMAHLLAGPDADPFTLPWQRLGYQHTQALRTQLDERYAPATANRMLAALRGVLTECWRLGLMDAEARARASDVAAVRGTTIPRGRALKGGELRALFAVCSDGSAAGARDAALLATLYAGGLRRSEAVALDLADYDPTYSPDASALTVRHGKGRKERVVYVQNGARRAMGDWLAIRGDAAGPLFQRLRKGGVLVPTRLTDQAVLDILQRRCTQAGVKACSPHDLRRTMISDLLDADAERHKIYERIPPENPYGDIDSLLHAEVGLTKAQAERDVALRAEIAQPQPTPKEAMAGNKNAAKSVNSPDDIRAVSRGYGTSADYLTARIARDRPDILDRMKEGEYKSVRRAAIDAGILPDPHGEDAAVNRLFTAWRHASLEDRQLFLWAVDDEIEATYHGEYLDQIARARGHGCPARYNPAPGAAIPELEALIDTGGSISVVARNLGVSQRTVCRWRAGNTKPSGLIYEKILDLHGALRQGREGAQ